MSMNDKPVWLLDIDGVINAIGRKPDPSVWPRDLWTARTVAALPILVAEPVLQFIRDVHASGLAEIRWHTTWQNDAVHVFAPEFNLPELPVHHCPEFHAGSVAARGGSSLGGPETWWKLPAALRVVHEEGRRLIWTDDDLEMERWRAYGLGGLSIGLTGSARLLISPQDRLGLTPKHLRQIAEFIGSPDLAP